MKFCFTVFVLGLFATKSGRFSFFVTIATQATYP